ncbi:MAG: histidine phosphatase family protein [Anaerolineae bacterium]
MTTRLILVRHGETEWNRTERFQGHANVSLNEVGRRQARALARRLSKEGDKISTIYASDLARAYETAQIIAEALGKAVVARQDLREVDIGAWSGRTMPEISELFPEELEGWQGGVMEMQRGGGESYLDLQKRAVKAFAEIAARHPQETIVVVTHGGTMRAFLCDILNMPLRNMGRISLDNASLSEVNYDQEKPRVVRLNDLCHLEG